MSSTRAVLAALSESVKAYDLYVRAETLEKTEGKTEDTMMRRIEMLKVWYHLGWSHDHLDELPEHDLERLRADTAAAFEEALRHHPRVREHYVSEGKWIDYLAARVPVYAKYRRTAAD